MQKMTWVAAALMLSAAPAFAQFDNAWVTYQNQTSSRLVAASGLGALDPEAIVTPGIYVQRVVPVQLVTRGERSAVA